VCSRCDRTLGDVFQHDGFACVVARTKGQREQHALPNDGPTMKGTTGPSGKLRDLRTLASDTVSCRCGADHRLSPERAQLLLRRAVALNLPAVRL